MNFPQSIPVKDIDAKCGEYNTYVRTWSTVADLNEGGDVLRERVLKGNYLLRKPKEVADVFSVRQSRFSYTPLLTNVTGWYQSALFKVAPQLTKKPKNADVAAEDAKIRQDEADFCTQFEKDCDGAGTAFVDFWRKVFLSMVLHRDAYVLLDLPAAGDDDAPASLADQTKAGLLNPFLVMYEPSQVINWETDRYGNLEWCIVSVSNEEREAFKAPVIADYWYYFDRQQVACYKAVRKDRREANDEAVLEPGYPRPHAMSDLNRMPVRRVRVPDGLWLANRVFLPLLNHLNLDNAFDFALFQSALAQLVIIGEYRDQPAMSEVAYLALPEGSDAKYLEPSGTAYDAIDERLHGLEERIYRACYLMDQARTNKATPSAQSGVSKEMDKTPSRDALSGFGDVIRAAMQLVYQDVLEVRGFTDVQPDVRGFDFEDKPGADEMDFLEKSTVIDVQSDTYRRERDKRFVRTVLPDANPETMAKIDQEIQNNPTPEGAAQLQQEEQKAQQIAGFSKSLQAGNQIGG